MSIVKLNLAMLLLLTASIGHGADRQVFRATDLEALLTTTAIDYRKNQLGVAQTKTAEDSRGLLKTLASAPTVDPVSEYLLHKAVLDLDATPADATIQEVVERLAKRDATIFVLLEEEGHAGIPVPAFDVAAAARFKLAQWTESEAHANFAKALQAGQFRMNNFHALTHDQRSGLKAALNNANEAQLRGARSELQSALQAGLPIADLVADVALKLADEALFTLALKKNGNATSLHQQVIRIKEIFTPQQGFELLKTAADSRYMESIALLQMASLNAAIKPSAVDFLVGKLSSPGSAGSAAAALAKFHDAGLNRQLGDLLHDGNAVTQRGAALALRFEGSQQAIAILQDFSRSADGDPELKREIDKWL